jgi:hypothetical protein
VTSTLKKKKVLSKFIFYFLQKENKKNKERKGFIKQGSQLL